MSSKMPEVIDLTMDEVFVKIEAPSPSRARLSDNAARQAGTVIAHPWLQPDPTKLLGDRTFVYSLKKSGLWGYKEAPSLDVDFEIFLKETKRAKEQSDARISTYKEIGRLVEQNGDDAKYHDMDKCLWKLLGRNIHMQALLHVGRRPSQHEVSFFQITEEEVKQFEGLPESVAFAEASTLPPSPARAIPKKRRSVKSTTLPPSPARAIPKKRQHAPSQNKQQFRKKRNEGSAAPVQNGAAANVESPSLEDRLATLERALNWPKNGRCPERIVAMENEFGLQPGEGMSIRQRIGKLEYVMLK